MTPRGREVPCVDWEQLPIGCGESKPIFPGRGTGLHCGKFESRKLLWRLPYLMAFEKASPKAVESARMLRHATGLLVTGDRLTFPFLG